MTNEPTNEERDETTRAQLNKAVEEFNFAMHGGFKVDVLSLTRGYRIVIEVPDGYRTLSPAQTILKTLNWFRAFAVGVRVTAETQATAQQEPA